VKREASEESTESTGGPSDESSGERAGDDKKADESVREALETTF
jgi:hypothetical protein